jgi:hypothetical protein
MPSVFPDQVDTDPSQIHVDLAVGVTEDLVQQVARRRRAGELDLAA